MHRDFPFDVGPEGIITAGDYYTMHGIIVEIDDIRLILEQTAILCLEDRGMTEDEIKERLKTMGKFFADRTNAGPMVPNFSCEEVTEKLKEVAIAGEHEDQFEQAWKNAPRAMSAEAYGRTREEALDKARRGEITPQRKGRMLTPDLLDWASNVGRSILNRLYDEYPDRERSLKSSRDTVEVDSSKTLEEALDELDVSR